jgi:hypothetical protein
MYNHDATKIMLGNCHYGNFAKNNVVIVAIGLISVPNDDQITPDQLIIT